MKVSEMIKNLQEFMEVHGDLECYYAIDDEGNAYHPVYYDPSMYYLDEYGDNIYHQEDWDETDEEDRENWTHICVVN